MAGKIASLYSDEKSGTLFAGKEGVKRVFGKRELYAGQVLTSSAMRLIYLIISTV